MLTKFLHKLQKYDQFKLDGNEVVLNNSKLIGSNVVDLILYVRSIFMALLFSTIHAPETVWQRHNVRMFWSSRSSLAIELIRADVGTTLRVSVVAHFYGNHVLLIGYCLAHAHRQLVGFTA